jgi:hypothetical protein
MTCRISWRSNIDSLNLIIDTKLSFDNETSLSYICVTRTRHINKIEGSNQMSDSSLTRNSSWVIVDKETGQPVLETFNQDLLQYVNLSRYDIVPIIEWLQSLNRR